MGQGVIPDDWTGEYCRYAVCWPNSEQWLAVLRGVLTLPARGRFWDEHTGNIVSAQNVIRETFDNNLHLEEVIMSCNDTGLADIAQALILLAQAQQRSGCCESVGSGGEGQTAPPFNPEQQGNPDTDPPPEGFEDWEDFFNQKCAVAWNIVEQLETDMGNMIIINLTGSTLSGLGSLIAITIVTPIPFDDIIAIAAFLLSVGSTIVISTALDIINSNEEVLACALYNGNSATSSRDLFMSEFNALVDSGVSDPIENFAVKQFTAYMIGSPVTNRLYEKDLTKVWGDRDCSACTDECNLTWDFADGTTQGWSATTVDPGCMALGPTPLASISVIDEKLHVQCVPSGVYHEGTIRITGLNWEVPLDWQLDVNLYCEGAVTMRADGVITTVEGSCISINLALTYPCVDYNGLSNTDPSIIGEHVNAVYIRMRSVAEASDLRVDFETIQLTCL